VHVVSDIFPSGKNAPLKNSLVIDRPGNITSRLLSSQSGQPLVEAIAQLLLEPAERSGDSNTLFFEVRDKTATAHGHGTYLLRSRNGMASCSFSNRSCRNSAPLQTISAFAQRAGKIPQSDEPDISLDQEIVRTTQQLQTKTC